MAKDTELATRQTWMDHVTKRIEERVASGTMSEIVEQTFEAQSIDELLSGGATDIDSVIGVPLLIESVDWQPSELNPDLPFYAVVHCRDLSGASFVTTCGGERICSQLYMAESRGWLPFTAIIRRADTQAGFRTYFLAKAPA